jgi:hypothetical protein
VGRLGFIISTFLTQGRVNGSLVGSAKGRRFAQGRPANQWLGREGLRAGE